MCLEANLETHSNDDLGPEYISNSGFKDLADNLGINLEEFRFKYSNVSEICEHKYEVSERCYELSKVLHIFAELKAGLLTTKGYPCCFSKMPLCSTGMRDRVCSNQISKYPPGFPVNGGECLLNEGAYWGLSVQRLKAEGLLFYDGEKEYTLEQNIGDFYAWKSYLKKSGEIIKKALRLESQTSLIYRDKENISDYY